METSYQQRRDNVLSTTDKVRSGAVILPFGAQQAQIGFLDAFRIMLLGLLMVAPLLFGAVQPWAWGAIVIASALLFLLWGLGCVRAGTVRITWSPLLLPLLGVLVLAGVQLWFGLSTDYVSTREATIKLLGFALVFFIGQQLYLSASPQAWESTGTAITIYLFLMALFAIVQFFASPGLIFGLIRPGSDSVFGPYVNRGNYAGLMEMLIPVAVTFAISLRWRHPARPFVLFVTFTALVSMFLSGSRAGLISLFVEFLILCLAVRVVGSEQRRIVIVGIVVAALAVGFVFWLDPGDVWARWKQMANKPELALGSRKTIAQDSFRMCRDHLAHGVGLGAFQVAYTPYQTVVTDLTIDFAHDDYLQFLAETGIWGWIVVPVSIGVFFWLSFRQLRSRLRQQSGWLQFGAAIGICGLLVHSMSEFNLHIPANAAWFSFLVALATLPRMRLGRV